KKTQLMQGQAEYRNCVQKADQLKQEKEQLLALTPELKNLLKLTPGQIEQMQADYQALPGAVNEPAYVTTNDKLWYVIGAVLAALGVVLLVALGTVGVIALITGLIFLAAGYLKNSNQNKQNAAVLEKQKLVAQKRQAFRSEERRVGK